MDPTVKPWGGASGSAVARKPTGFTRFLHAFMQQRFQLANRNIQTVVRKPFQDFRRLHFSFKTPCDDEA